MGDGWPRPSGVFSSECDFLLSFYLLVWLPSSFPSCLVSFPHSLLFRSLILLWYLTLSSSYGSALISPLTLFPLSFLSPRYVCTYLFPKNCTFTSWKCSAVSYMHILLPTSICWDRNCMFENQNTVYFPDDDWSNTCTSLRSFTLCYLK